MGGRILFTKESHRIVALKSDNLLLEIGMGNLPILQLSTGDKWTEFGWCERRGHSISADVVDYAFKALENGNATPDDIQVYR
jgi:hypothetical protein